MELKSYNHSFFDEKLSWQSYKIIFNETDPAGLGGLLIVIPQHKCLVFDDLNSR
ncbi:hypothetical protein C427_4445 [Paraglaciecola psychrophila 170]|uniref:Uncharacterized protein n=1 Tax=Paraglaciecola psychrophila 170 TaxID=1129794 RepID=M4S7D1_9ALTE|nr:hypothetical protein C427_4445 [Paraglaciecola psychrophila 170]